MAKVTVWIQDDLRAEAKALKINVSAIVQHALHEEIIARKAQLALIPKVEDGSAY